MSLSTADVEHIAELAKLALTADEIEHYRQQLSDIWSISKPSSRSIPRPFSRPPACCPCAR